MSMLRTASKYFFAATDRLIAHPQGPRLLIYHRVGDFHGQQMEVTVDDFISHLETLATAYEVVSLDEALRRWDEPGSDRLVVITFDDGYVDTYDLAYGMLQSYGFPFTLYVATRQVEEASTQTDRSGSAALSWNQIGDMLGSGLVTIGAHTHTHADLRRIPSAEIQREIESSNELITARTGIVPIHFAYPWGYWSQNADDHVRSAYLSAALGGSPTAARAFDPYRVPRFPIQRSDGTRFFRARLKGGFRAEERLRRTVRGYSGP